MLESHTDCKRLKSFYYLVLLLATGAPAFGDGSGNTEALIDMANERGGPDNMERNGAVASLKAALFVAAWVVAFFLLPVPIVLGGLAIWAIGVTPGIISLHRHFQFAPEGEPDETNGAGVRDD